MSMAVREFISFWVYEYSYQNEFHFYRYDGFTSTRDLAV
jgi:hypothetical protein